MSEKNVLSELDELNELDEVNTDEPKVFESNSDDFDKDAFINDDSLSENPDDLIQDIKDNIETIKEHSITELESSTPEDLKKYEGTLQKLRNKLDQMVTMRGIDDTESFLLGNIRKNIAEIELLIEDLLVFMNETNKSPTPGVLRTISELVNSKTSCLELLAKYIHDRERLSIEKKKLDVLSGINPEGIPDDSLSLNEEVDQYFKKKNELISSDLENIDEDVVITTALSVEKIDDGSAPTVEALSKQIDTLDDLEGDD